MGSTQQLSAAFHAPNSLEQSTLTPKDSQVRVPGFADPDPPEVGVPGVLDPGDAGGCAVTSQR
jgi:hypothetical protein